MDFVKENPMIAFLAVFTGILFQSLAIYGLITAESDAVRLFALCFLISNIGMIGVAKKVPQHNPVACNILWLYGIGVILICDVFVSALFLKALPDIGLYFIVAVHFVVLAFSAWYCRAVRKFNHDHPEYAMS